MERFFRLSERGKSRTETAYIEHHFHAFNLRHFSVQVVIARSKHCKKDVRIAFLELPLVAAFVLTMQWIRDNYWLSDDKALLDMDTVTILLQATYWAFDRPKDMIEKAVRHSLCLGLYLEGAQIGFCRAVTDYETFTWICDVVIAETHRGKGLGKWMVQRLVDHPLLQTRSQVLATRDAHTLYERFDFQRTEYMKRMIKKGEPPSSHPA